ncbi:M48 family metallopeptidase [Croceimicrobium hydrocarbonivorans]|uniref:M48 family metalloprotease n=1 Tax=Croceimicrobium hydrocarbonivorans TaxID=2761580 RepID=A0A7H0VGK1_9FLAO|nr:M48 family metallopeptidase [Croceimicrobium hydrocarbonivorans]QNR24849.1 M48 family metalloprotease [Croceimicrobium hydrocarbonivorans]
MKKSLIPVYLLFLLFVSNGSFAQSVGHNYQKDYHPIQVAGYIPEDFLDRLDQDVDSLKIGDPLSDYEFNQYYSTLYFLKSGKFSFGDPVSLYLERIKNKLLQDDPNLSKEIRIYLYRSSSPIGFCLGNGIIGIGPNLIAHLQSEDELAFVIAHEIAHYKLKHSFESFVQNRIERTDLDRVEYLESLVHRSKNQELEADSIGAEIFQAAGYQLEAAEECLVHLHGTYHPFGRCHLDTDLFELGDFPKVPSYYLEGANDSVSTDYEYVDDSQCHPNIQKRIGQIQRQPKVSSQSKTAAIASFEEFKLQCSFEAIHWQLLEQDYAEAWYNIACLKEQFPSNQFLIRGELRALYGLAAFKSSAANYLQEKEPRLNQGPVQAFYLFLRRVSSKQFTAITRRKILNYLELNPNDLEAQMMMKDLNRMFFAHNNILDPYREFLKPLPDLHFEPDSTLSPRRREMALKYHYVDYYLHLIPELRDSAAIEATMLEDQSYLEKAKQGFSAKNVEKPEVPYPLDSVLVLEPRIIPYSKDLYPADFRTCREVGIKVYSYMVRMKDKFSSGTDPLFRADWDTTALHEYNLGTQFNALIREAYWMRKTGFSTCRKYVPGSMDPLNYNYLFGVIAVYNLEDDDPYYCYLINLQNGDILYKRDETYGIKISAYEIDREMRYDLRQIGAMEGRF